jgi:hypothetical protein
MNANLQKKINLQNFHHVTFVNFFFSCGNLNYISGVKGKWHISDHEKTNYGWKIGPFWTRKWILFEVPFIEKKNPLTLGRLVVSDILAVDSQISKYLWSRIFHPRPDLKWSLNSLIMIKANQHMFPNKILVKTVNLCENLDCKSLKIVI